MFQRIINKLKTFYYVRFKHYTINEINIEKWRKSGIEIGDNCIFCCSLPVGRDNSLLSFGNNVLVSVNVLFLMHDASPTVLAKDESTDIIGKVHIGNSCFIGANSIIMPGVSLADYTLVGAGSVVTHSTVQPGQVIAGNPAKVICTVDEYLSKNKDYLVNLDGIDYKKMIEFARNNSSVLIEKSSFK